MAEWPATLPSLIKTGAQFSADDAVVRSNMDAGPPSRRNRFTATTASVAYEMEMNQTQLEILNTFYRDTLRNGALAFEWCDLRDGSVAQFAFKRPPVQVLMSGKSDSGERRWTVSLSLEIQP